MSDSVSLDSISQIHEAVGLPKPKHPLVTVIHANDIQTTGEFQDVKIVINLYQVALKQGIDGTLMYGRNQYDFQEGTLVFTQPGQVLKYESASLEEDGAYGGWILCFHPDLIRKSDLSRRMSHYSFFDYDANEALHISEEERLTLEDLLGKITKEYSQNLDKHSHHLIVSNIQMVLDYCVRFYDRQFYTRANLNSDLVSRFERLLKTYFQSDRLHDLGLPTVNYCAQELHLSPKYLSDLLKKQTGKSAHEHIHLFVIDRAKNRLLNSSDPVSAIAYGLGFSYPQHFSSLFKAKTGLSPREYRNLN